MNLNLRLIEKFKEACDNVTLQHCYENYKVLGCRYDEQVMKKLEEIEKTLDVNDDTPWWTELIY
jgi:hypothetical protein